MKSKCFMIVIIIFLITVLTGCSTFAPEFRVMEIQTIWHTMPPWDEQLELEFANARFFETLEKEHNAFIVDTSNFNVMHENDGQRIWEFNEQQYLSGEFDHFWPSAFCPHGRTISVSIHYFLHNPIIPIDGGNLLDNFVFEPYTLNILVPEALRVYEEDIISAHRSGFWFDKIDVENIYNEFIGNPLNQTAESDLSINIIYVENNQTYFTFDSAIESENNNLITDPVVRVLLPGNIHPAQLRPITQAGVFLYGNQWRTQDFDTGRNDLRVNAIRRLR